MTRTPGLLSLLTALLLMVLPAKAQEWTRFRGPNGSGLAASMQFPEAAWGPSNLLWKAVLPGPGHSSPALWSNRVFLCTGDASGSNWLAICLDADDGKTVWQKSWPITRYARNSYNTAASSSPAVDKSAAYFCCTTPESHRVLALTHQGAVVWERNLGPYPTQHGGGVSPIVYRDMVIVPNEQDKESFIAALDAATGALRWKAPRETSQAMYATPCVYELSEGKAALVFAGQSHGISALDPSTGQVLWELPGVFDKRVVSSPILAPGLVIGSCGNGGGVNYVAAVKAGPKPELAYTIRRQAPYVPTSILVGDLLFLWSDNGVVSCVTPASGEIKWQERVGGMFFSSPVCVGGHLYCVSTRGDVVVLNAGAKFELLARNPLGETVHSTPAVARGRMYIHTTRSLVCIGTPPS